MSDRSPARASGAGRGVLGGREVTAGSVAPALWGTLHFALASQSVPPLPLGRPGNAGGGDTWRMPATRAWRSGVFWRHRTPGPGSCRRQKETDLDRWAAPSAVACVARGAQDPLRAGAGRRGLIRRPGPPVESPRPPAQSPLLRPASRGPFSTQVTSGLPLSPSASPGLRAPRLAVHQLPVFVQENMDASLDRLPLGAAGSTAGRGPRPGLGLPRPH